MWFRKDYHWGAIEWRGFIASYKGKSEGDQFTYEEINEIGTIGLVVGFVFGLIIAMFVPLIIAMVK